MADYSFSSSAMRKRKSNFKTKSALGEGSDTPTQSLTPQSSSPQQSTNASPPSTSSSRSKKKEPIASAEQQSHTPKATGSKVQRYEDNMKNSQWPPPTVSDDSDHDIPRPDKTNGRPGNVWQPPKSKLVNPLRREPALEDSSVDSSDDGSEESTSSSGDGESESSSSLSDDSDHETTKKIDKYRQKYLNGDNDGKQHGKSTRDTGSPLRDTESEDPYDKYKKQLNESKRSDEKWLSPKKKLGAPPEIDYNYRYLNAPKLPLEDNSQSELQVQDTNSKKPKLGKVDLKSQKIDKDDLGILASMLGDDSSMDDASSQGVFSVSSADGSAIGRRQQGSPFFKKQNQKSDSSRGVSNSSVKSNNTEEQPLKGLDSSERVNGKPESPKEPVSIRMAKLQQQRREKEGNSLSSHSVRSSTSDMDDNSMTSPAPEIKKRMSSVGVPPMIREHEVEEDLGQFLRKEHEDREKAQNKGETSERSDDDFSAIWAQSVAASRTKVKPQVDDESSTEGSIDIHGQQDKVESAPRESPTAPSSIGGKKDRPGVAAPSNPSTTTLETSISTTPYEASGRSSVSSSGIEMSARWSGSDELLVEQNPRASYATNKRTPSAQPALAYTRSNEVTRDNLDSDSDESVDFEKLTDMEQYTMGDSKGSSIELETPLLSNKKETATKHDENDRNKKNGQAKRDEKDTNKKTGETTRDEKETNKKNGKATRDEKDTNKKNGKTTRDEKDTNKQDGKTTRDEKDTKPKNDQKGQLMAVSNVKEEEIEVAEDSDGSLDMVNDMNSRQPQQQKKAPVKKKSISRDKDDDSSMSGFSLYPAKDLIDERSSSEFNKPEYKPQRNNMSAELDFNEGFQNLDSSALVDLDDSPVVDLEDPKEVDIEKPPDDIKGETVVPSAEKTDKPKLRPRESLFPTGLLRHLGRTWFLLLALGAIGLPIFFLLFFGDDESATLPAPLDLFPLPPTLAPTNAPVAPPTNPPIATTMPVTLFPTQMPSIPTVPVIPTPSPTTSRISILREFLISIWPSLENDLIGFASPQYAALNWLANNANYDDYSDERLIQRFALATFFYSTRGQRWRNNDGWLSNDDECTWYSRSSQPQCDGSGNYVRLSLGLNDLWGTIPSEVALLGNLVEIDFSTSSSVATLSSTIPAEIGLLVSLEELILRGNDLSGTLASEIGNLANLDNLDLSNNLLSGTLPSEVGGLTRLRFWNLAQNNFGGSLPTTLGLMTALQQLQLNNNDLTGPIPAELGQLSLLNSLDLTRNRLSRLPTDLSTLVLLQKFSAANNLLEGPLPNGIGNSIELLSLELQNNRLTGTIPTEIGNLVELRDVLDLSSNEFSGPIPTEMGRLIFLRNILLQSNRLTGSVPSSFAALRRVSVLRLESNDLTGVVADATCAVFNQTFPVFATDCTPPEIICPCCMFCCEDNGDCACQFADTDLSFLCSEFVRAPGLEDRIVIT